MIFRFCEAPKTRDFHSYSNYLASYVLDMFKWQLDFAPVWVIEQLLTRRGTVGIFKNGKDGEPVIAAGAYSGAATQYLFGSDYIGTTLNGETYSGKVGEDVIVLWNNLTLTPDTYTVSSYAERLAEVDKSILNVIRGSRITSIITATDNTDKITLDNVVKAIEDGDVCVKIPPAYKEIDALDNGAKRFDVLRITDPKDSDKLQYLSRYRDDIISSFLNEYGLDVDMINKGSQITRDELHSMSDAVNAVVSQRLECRRRDLDIVRSWGYNIDVYPNVGRGTRINDTMESEVLTDDNTAESEIDRSITDMDTDTAGERSGSDSEQ